MIIIPTYNERGNIGPLIARIRKVLPSIVVLFVDDSSDTTGDEIKNLQLSDPNIQLIQRGKKTGFASAYIQGLKSALATDTEFVIMMDGDLSHPPEQLPLLIEAARIGHVGIGSRYTPGGTVQNWKLWRRYLSRGANFYAQTFSRIPVKDATSGYLAIPRERVSGLDLNKIRSRGYAFLMELKIALHTTGAKFVEIPIVFEERKMGQSKLDWPIFREGLRYPSRVFLSRQIRQNLYAWVLFIVSFAVYLLTLPHSIYFGDSPEFMASAATLGVSHPPGYPLYSILGKLFTFLPFGNLEFRIGMLSALSASLSLCVFYFLFQRISANKWIGFVTALMLGFSNLFWSQAIMAKVYMPLVLVFLIILLLIAKFWETRKSGYMLTVMLLFGLGTGFHEIILLFLPLAIWALIVYIKGIDNRRTYRFKTESILAGLGLFVLGLGIFLYLPIREMSHGNFFDFSKVFEIQGPKNLSGLYHYFFRTEYADFGGKFMWQEKVTFVSGAMLGLWRQFGWLLFLLPIGLIELWFSNKRFFVLTFGAFWLNILGIILLRGSHWNLENDFLSSFYYLPAFVMAALWMGLGLVFIFRQLGKVLGKQIFAVAFFLLIIPIILFNRNYPVNNLSSFSFVDDYINKVLESLPPDAVLLANYPGSNTDTLLFGFTYQQIVKHKRPDVTILKVDDIYPEVDRKAINFVYGLDDPQKARYHLVSYALKIYKTRPIYTTYLLDNLMNKPQAWSEVSNGLVYKFYPTPPTSDSVDFYELDYKTDLPILASNLFGQDILSEYFYTQAAYWVQKQDLVKAQNNFISAIKYDYKPEGIDQQAYQYYRNRIIKP